MDPWLVGPWDDRAHNCKNNTDNAVSQKQVTLRYSLENGNGKFITILYRLFVFLIVYFIIYFLNYHISLSYFPKNI